MDVELSDILITKFELLVLEIGFELNQIMKAS
jgi:hypothetical protein